MASFPIYADSYSGIGAGLANQAAMQERDRQFALSNLLAASQFAHQMDQKRKEQAQSDAYRKMAFDEEIRQFNERLKYEREMPRLPTAGDFNVASNLVAGGRSPANVTAFTPDQQAFLQQQATEYMTERGEQEKLAQALTARETATARLAREKNVPQASLLRKVLSFFFNTVSPTPGSAAIPLPPEDLELLERRATAAQAGVPPMDPRDLEAMVRLRSAPASPMARGYEPLLPAPQFNFLPGTPTNAPAAGVRRTMPMLPPDATATATNMPPSAVGAIANPYVPGRRYGNLRYIGGDPNLETSWVPVR